MIYNVKKQRVFNILPWKNTNILLWELRNTVVENNVANVHNYTICALRKMRYLTISRFLFQKLPDTMLETVLGRKRDMLALKSWDMVSSISLNQEIYIMYIFSFVLVC